MFLKSLFLGFCAQHGSNLGPKTRPKSSKKDQEFQISEICKFWPVRAKKDHHGAKVQDGSENHPGPEDHNSVRYHDGVKYHDDDFHDDYGYDHKGVQFTTFQIPLRLGGGREESGEEKYEKLNDKKLLKNKDGYQNEVSTKATY